MSTIVAGVDFGTLSVRVSIVDSEKGVIGHDVAEYPLKRSTSDPDYATQSHDAHMKALAAATRGALTSAGVAGSAVKAIALDTTGSTVVPLGAGLVPLDDYYMWCDHRAKDEAARITEVAHELNVPAIEWCGGVYSSEWGWAKALHWLRHHRSQREKVVTFAEHADMVAATLCGITEVAAMPRSVCVMGHKWLWGRKWGGFPANDFFRAVDPLLDCMTQRMGGRYGTSDTLCGTLTEEWAGQLGLSAGIPIPTGAFDCHWDAIGSGIAVGDVVNVLGTTSCIMAIADSPNLVPGVCGVVPGSIHPQYAGVEAGLSALGYLYEVVAQRTGSTVADLSREVTSYCAGQTGLLRLTWDNGDRTVLVNPNLGGVTFGWTLTSTPRDELFAAIEGTAMHTRIVCERMRQYGVPTQRMIHGGGIPQKNDVVNRVFANALNMPVLVPESPVTSLGAAIFAFMAVGTFPTIEAAQQALFPGYRVIEPDPSEVAIYDRLFPLYERLYFAMGQPNSKPVAIGDILPSIRALAAEVKSKTM